jgi:hypothetical protein
MPSVSKNQQIAAAIALKAKKEGKEPEAGTASAQMAKMSKKDLEKFAKTKHKGLPRRKSKKKVNEAWGQKLDLYLDIIWRWFERQGYAEHEIDSILNDEENMSVIQSAEAHGINPILVARDLKTTQISVVSESVKAPEGVLEKAADIFFGEYLAEKGFFVNKFTNLPEFDLRDPDSEMKIVQDFSKYLEEEHYEDWDPALEATIYKEIVEEFLADYRTNESLNELYSPITLEEFLHES